MTTKQAQHVVGDSQCLCRESDPSDRPCSMCAAAAVKAATPAAPAFSLRNATVWVVVVAYQIGEAQCTRSLLVMSADTTGADLAQIALVKVRADTPGADRLRLLRVELQGDCWGTAVVPGEERRQ